MKCPNCQKDVPFWEIHRNVIYTKGITDRYQKGFSDNRVVERKCEYCLGWKQKPITKTLITILFLLLFSYTQAFEVTVYGRNSCGFTQALRNELAVNSVPYTYCNIDSTGCLGQLYSVAIEFNLAVNGVINLPVVLVIIDGKRYGYVRPSITTILKITSSLEIENEKLVYPNPATDIIHVSGDVEIYNMYGILLLKSHNRHISIAALPQGIYFVRVNGNMHSECML